jgi:hypothetical protein
MQQLDLNELADLIAETVIDAVRPLHKALADQQALITELRSRLDSLPDARSLVVAELQKFPVPRDGKDADADAIMAAARAAVAEIPKAADGKDADLTVVATLVREEIAKALAVLPAPKDGKDADPAAILAAARAAVAELPRPADGKDADPEAIAAAAKAAVDALPPPQDGRSVTLEKVAPLVQEAVVKAVAAIPAPKDGASIALCDVMPHLRADVQKWFEALPRPKDGDSITLGDVLPALESMQAKWELDFERRAMDFVQRMVDRFPKPKDGEDGRDGFGFDDLSFEQLNERAGVIRFRRGDVVKEFPVAMAGFVDKGLWQEQQYEKGDGVTWDGNYWLARRATSAKPGTEGEDAGNNDWRVAVRKGRKGKDGINGRDLTNPKPPKLSS